MPVCCVDLHDAWQDIVESSPRSLGVLTRRIFCLIGPCKEGEKTLYQIPAQAETSKSQKVELNMPKENLVNSEF